jgi:DNA (cytosine-5)-methyltransferase 1
MFSGAGGMDRGFIKTGHRIVWANDINKDACASYEQNLNIEPLCTDIKKVEHFPSAEIVVACNPCQGFSIIGPRNPEDPRNYLYKEIVRCLKQVKPKFFVTENVKGLKSLYSGRFLNLLLREFTDCGYDVNWQILDAKYYGVPQDRERLFIVGVRKDLGITYQFPRKTHGEGGKPFVTLRDAIGHLPPPRKGEYWDDNHYPFFYMSRNRRRDWNDVSYTIQASGRHAPLHPSSPPMKKLGPDSWVFTKAVHNYRRLSLKECALIQTFETTDVFVGNLRSQYVQVGNSVPPLLAQRIAESISLCSCNEAVTPIKCAVSSSAAR